MILMNFIHVCCSNAYSRIASWKEKPSSAIYNTGYAYDYSKTDE